MAALFCTSFGKKRALPNFDSRAAFRFEARERACGHSAPKVRVDALLCGRSLKLATPKRFSVELIHSGVIAGLDPAIHRLAKKMDPRVIRAFTPVFRRAMPASDN